MSTKKDRKFSERIDALFNFMSAKTYGDIIYHKQVENILGISRDLNAYGLYVKFVKDKMIKQSKVLKPIAKIGWQILKPNQVSSYTYRRYIQRTLKAYDYSKFILENLEVEGLSKARKGEYADVKELNQQLKKISEATIKESRYYSRKDY